MGGVRGEDGADDSVEARGRVEEDGGRFPEAGGRTTAEDGADVSIYAGSF